MITVARRKVPLWVVVASVAVVALIAGLIGALVMANKPSEADLAVRAMAGDREAGAKLEAKYATPTPQPIKSATFTPGTYTVDQVKQFSVAECQSDGAKAVACFETFVYLGDVERARAVLGHVDPAATRVITYVREWWQVHTKEEGLKLVGVNVHSLYRYPEIGMTGRVEPAGKGPFVPGKYSARVEYFTDPKDSPWARHSLPAELILGGDGKWRNAPDFSN